MKITIDGPAGSGKSTIARLISLRLKIPYLETGTVYRAFAYILLREKENANEGRAVNLVRERPLGVKMDVGSMEIHYKGRDITGELGGEDVGRVASIIASFPSFKEEINKYFREIVKGQAVIEGRDAGLYIFPDADIKFFITASPEERAKRRWKQLRERGEEVSYEEILKSIKERDDRDTKRPKYPFKPAKDALIIDTTNMTVEEVTTHILKEIYRCISNM